MADPLAISTNATTELVSKMELSLSCSNLIKLDTLSKSDPLVVVYLQRAGKWEEIGRTEALKNAKDAQFTKTIPIRYYFEEVQHLKFLILDVDSDKLSVESGKGFETIGEILCCMGDIVSSRGAALTKDIQNAEHPKRKNGSLTIRAVEVGGGNTSIRFALSGRNLDKKDFLSKSDPYVIIHRLSGDGKTFTVVHKTEVIQNNLNPIWKPFEVPVGSLCGGNRELPLFVECYDWDSHGKHDLIGQFTTTLSQIQSQVEFSLIEPKIQKKKGKSYTNSGILVMANKEIVHPTFLDFVTSGTEVSLVVGIDFTGSNGEPTKPHSLHYLDPVAPNQYQQALGSVGAVVAPYDRDGMIPTFGFGAQLLNSGSNDVSHCFSLTGDPNQPNCYGIHGVMTAYSQCFSWVRLYGPTNFSPIIETVCSMASAVQGAEKYFILLMLTDGAITDMNETKKSIQKATNLPISIIIVGVGNADFENMNALDDDEGALNFKRDIVQFVPFNKFRNATMEQLAKETLKEVPGQLLEYMKIHDFQPLRHMM